MQKLQHGYGVVPIGERCSLVLDIHLRARGREIAGDPVNADARIDQISQPSVVVFMKVADHHQVDMLNVVRPHPGDGRARGIASVSNIDQHPPSIGKYNQMAVGLPLIGGNIHHRPAGFRAV